uniref:Uncharacterized protein n=1 Tax=Hucho hucho TaxID=62062 RepID=A0A4W5LKP6_9TELE
MTRRQKPWKNLTMDTLEELALVMAAMQKNMAAYREIWQELDSIVEEVHSLSFNVEQEVMMRNHITATLQDKLLNNDIATGHTRDILSTLITLEKELFVQHLALSSFNNGPGKDQTLLYSDLANTVEEKETFQFLTDILPKKILVRDYLKLLEENPIEEADN